MVGPKIHLRADANQRWTFGQAVEFANAVRGCGLQYLEEPVKNSDDLLKFCKETGFPVAIDESVDKNAENNFEAFSHLGLAAAIIKPSSVGGFERAAKIARWAQSNGMLAIISSAFESSISLAVYSQFAAHVDERRLESITPNIDNGKRPTPNSIIPQVAHGLGTFMWIGNDVLHGNRFPVKSTGDGVEVSIRDGARMLQNLTLNKETVQVGPCIANIRSQIYRVRSTENEFEFQVLDTKDGREKTMELSVLVFFHGFLGNSRDWLPVMHALSASNRCISIDLPGHGQTRVTEANLRTRDFQNSIDDYKSTQTDSLSMENVAEALNTLLMNLSVKKVTLVGYSMGARLALYMALRCNQQVCAAVIISGSPGIQNLSARNKRASQDDAVSLSLQRVGLESFIETWYQNPMWKSLRNHPGFVSLKASRRQHQDVNSLAKVLSSMSVGRQPSLWKDLGDPPVPLLLVAGKNDTKFSQIGRKMYGEVCVGGLTGAGSVTTSEKSSKSIHATVFNQEMNNYQLKELLALRHGPQDKGANEKENKRFMLEEALSLQRDKPEDEGEIRRRKFMNLLELDNTGHAVHIENPLLLVNGISKFVRRLGKTSAVG